MNQKSIELQAPDSGQGHKECERFKLVNECHHPSSIGQHNIGRSCKN